MGCGVNDLLFVADNALNERIVPVRSHGRGGQDYARLKNILQRYYDFIFLIFNEGFRAVMISDWERPGSCGEDILPRDHAKSIKFRSRPEP